jgi:hypothetical protein
MPNNSRPRRQRRSFLFTEYRAPLRNETPEIRARLDHYQAHGDTASRDAVILFFLPLCRVIAAQRCKRAPEIYPFEETLSDATLGLISAIDSADHRRASSLMDFFRQAIRWAVGNGIRARRDGRDTSTPDRIIAKARAALTQDLGRTPTPEELAEKVADKITNPLFYIHRRLPLQMFPMRKASSSGAPPPRIARWMNGSPASIPNAW